MTDKKWSRRQFLETAGQASLGAAAVSVAACEVEPVQEEPVDPFADAPTTVSIVGTDGDVEAAVRRAVELAGGLDAIQPGDTVFIKPNAVGTVPGAIGFTTSHDVLAAVIRLVKERDPGHVVVGDRSARLFESSIVFEQTGMGAAALGAGADEVYPAPKPENAPDEYVLLQPEGWEETWEEAGGILALRRVVEADHLINVPVAKNHRWAGHSMAMKNLMGCVGDDSRDPMHYKANDPSRLSRDIVILNQMFQPTMTVIDAQTCIVNGGPEGMLADGVVTEPNLIIAGSDRVSLDVLGVCLIQEELTTVDVADPDARHELLTTTDPWLMPQVLEALDLDIDTARHSDDTRLIFEGVGIAEALENRFRGS